uniref:DUF3147 domain-containing protein n=1 Tax=viral metagenome TaxID=1070528 RepID=A0A6C0ELM1_9ZZZZ
MATLLSHFLVGGFVVAGTTMIATKFSSKTAAMFWAFPYTLMPTLIFLHMSNEADKKPVDLVSKTIGSAIILALYIIALKLLLDKFSFWTALGISIGIFLLLVGLFWLIVCPSPLGYCTK